MENLAQHTAVASHDNNKIFTFLLFKKKTMSKFVFPSILSLIPNTLNKPPYKNKTSPRPLTRKSSSC